ncbi:hypothetical protein VPH35_011908 [Triticum aestivum]
MARTPPRTTILHHLVLTLCVLSGQNTSSLASTAAIDEFLGCLSADIPSRLIQTPATPSYSALLLSTARNLRYILPDTSKPLGIIAATEHAHVQTTVCCGRRHGVRVRVRSGGHDYEGLSYASVHLNKHKEPFAVLDLAALRAIHVDPARAEAWVESGATLGELYYAVGSASCSLGFPAGSCPTVGIGGHLSGGGFGSLARKYGLSADNVLDALVVDADGRLMNRSTMGEDLFWAIRGGGGESFGVVLSWKVRLVPVPETVTVFSIIRSRNQSAIELITKWQEMAPASPQDLYLRVLVLNQQANFQALFLGRCGDLHRLMQYRFPELGMTEQNCQEEQQSALLSQGQVRPRARAHSKGRVGEHMDGVAREARGGAAHAGPLRWLDEQHLTVGNAVPAPAGEPLPAPVLLSLVRERDGGSGEANELGQGTVQGDGALRVQQPKGCVCQLQGP